jgi:acyl-CoA-binding protein
LRRNITKQKRSDDTQVIDSLSYKYDDDITTPSAPFRKNNRLYSVRDQIGASATTGDIDNMATGTANVSSNYKYDAEGRLIRDLQENIKSIIWRVDEERAKSSRRRSAASGRSESTRTVKEIRRTTYSANQKRITFDL